MKKDAPVKKTRPAGSTSSATKKRPSARNTAEVSVLTIPPLDRGELKSFLALKHGNPHSILGAHFVEGGIVIRAFRPDAERIEVLIGRKKPQPMTKIHDAGLFAIAIPNLTTIPAYRLQVSYPNDNTLIQRDGYAFLPTLGDLDLHLFAEGKHTAVYEKLGAHPRRLVGVRGAGVAVWAPNAAGVSVVGDFNGWDGRLHQMRRLGGSGVWELFIPDLPPGSLYKYEIRGRRGLPFLKADPYANYTEVPPATSSIAYQSTYKFRDAKWMRERANREHFRQPLSIYEVHFGSWRRIAEDNNRSLQYREMAPALADYVLEMGFTHVEFLPLKEHPYGPSWGYQVSNYFAPSARYGAPDDLRYLIDFLHRRGIGVIMDWVPAHFPKDAFALARFDGSALYEHLDPRKGEHPDWGTYIFNYGRNEVRNFLLGNAIYWCKEFHVDGLRVDAVASMLYLDYSRKEGEWVPNQFGGRENLEAISLLKEMNEVVHRECPGVMMIAEESTSWPQVTHPVYAGGVGFDFKWNMGWMHDTLKYFQTDTLFRGGNHNALTFGLLYAWSENFILPFSHDEVVHMKGALLNKMPGDEWQKLANLRALYGYMWAHPGKKLLFMGGEFGQWREWNETESLDWHLLEKAVHRGVQLLVEDLNKIYKQHGELWAADGEPAGFQWIEVNNAAENIISFRRIAPSTGKEIICVGNFSPIIREGHRMGLPRAGEYRQLLNTDDQKYCGGGFGVVESITAEAVPSHGLEYSALITLPPLATMWFEAPGL
jgi:1,4-alpha-glucan branching enzyme